MENQKKMLLCMPDSLVRVGISSICESQGFKVEVFGATEIHSKTRLTDFLIIVDETNKILHLLPRLRAKAIIVLTHEVREFDVNRMKSLGANAVLNLDMRPEELIKVFDLLPRCWVFDQSVLFLDRTIEHPTKRELEIVRLLVESNTMKATAHKLGISLHTVGTHKLNVMKKLDVHTQAELIRWYIKNYG